MAIEVAERLRSGKAAVTVQSTNMVAQTSPPLLPTLLRVMKIVRAYQNIHLTEIGLHNGQDEFLLALEVEQQTVAAIAEQLSVRASTVSKMTEILVAKGLVEKTSCKTDLRKTYVGLTADGALLCAAIRAVWLKLDEDLFHSAHSLNEGALQSELTIMLDHVAKRLARLR